MEEELLNEIADLNCVKKLASYRPIYFVFKIFWTLGLSLKWCGELLIKLAGPLFVITAWTLLSSVVYIFLKTILPWHVDPVFSPLGIAHLIVEIFLMQGVFFNYFMCVATPPGSPRDSDFDPELIKEWEEKPVPSRGKGFSKFCNKCRRPKPARTHHCSVCGVCVLKMDHHCPWVSNCVGHKNHRYFFLFLFYMFIGSIYVASMAWGPFNSANTYRIPFRGLSARGTIVFIFVMAVAVCLAVSLMFFWHLYLVLSGQTTIEFYFNRWKAQQAKLENLSYSNPFDLGMKKNWQFFFGGGRYYYLTWFLPNPFPAPGDGVSYPQSSKTGFSRNLDV
eukprot:TRINITY_DN13251_c0_g1_i1.p1 TRINITY_DN13251_c0_g1~~TRINITY_DN13251_c0_g1_i1.p1  ORF type:complete len:334 (+),score=25.67 TRINITY_DN13251_c0_g1_i1:48-1049(+)